jgi:hypothetical protein
MKTCGRRPAVASWKLGFDRRIALSIDDLFPMELTQLQARVARDVVAITRRDHMTSAILSS